MFDFSKVEDFDKHIALSIPNYRGMLDVFSALGLEYMQPGQVCIDIGCSTGAFISELSKKVEGQYIGVDEVDFGDQKYGGFTFVNRDVAEYLADYIAEDSEIPALIIGFFVLQFLGSAKRSEVIDSLQSLINSGSTLFLAEKVYPQSSRVHSILAREHLLQKRRSGFTEEEILDKDYDLLGSMFPLTHDEIEAELQFLVGGSGGVARVEQVWQSYSFRGWIIYPHP